MRQRVSELSMMARLGKFSDCLAKLFGRAQALQEDVQISGDLVAQWIQLYLIHLQDEGLQVPHEHYAIALSALLFASAGCLPDDLPIW